jgi:hypothetical protein
VARVAEHEPPEFEQCDVCGRTMLRGERLWDYVTGGGEPRRVCALCKTQAESAGWLPRELAAAAGEGPERQSRARALRERLSRAAEGARSRAAQSVQTDEPPSDGEPAGEPRRRRRLFVERAPQHGGGESEGIERPRPRSVTAARPTDPQSLARRAADRFNTSEARRTVAGLARSLGEPRASIQIANRVGDAKVTIAWELSWYQWEIDPGEHGAVREIRKGDELDELSETERAWNAHVAEDGSLRMTSD